MDKLEVQKHDKNCRKMTSYSVTRFLLRFKIPGFVGSDLQNEQSGYIPSISLVGTKLSPLPQ